MALTTPTTQTISDNILSQLEAQLNQTLPLLPRSFSRVLAKAIAGVFVILYKYAGFMFLQMFIKYASDQETEVNGRTVVPLVEWGRMLGVGDPTEATNAELLIDVTVTNQVGSLPNNSQLTNTTNGVTYITLGAVNLNAATVQVTVRAVSDQSGGGGAGIIGNLEAGSTLTFANPLPNIERDATVDSQTVTAAEAELTETYRQRVLDQFQRRPQGGAATDYAQWGESVAGIVNIYPYRGSPGQVNVYAEAVDQVNGIPTQAQLDAVLAAIELDDDGLASNRPVSAYTNVLPITRTIFTVDVIGVSDVDNLTQVETDITTGLNQFFLDREPFVRGVTVPPRLDRITQSAIAGVVEDIVTAAGGYFNRVVLRQNSLPLEFYQLGEGEKAGASSIDFF